MRGQVGDLRLFKIDVSPSKVTFTNSAASSSASAATNTTNNEAQGELIDGSLLAIGDLSPQGELIAAAASTRADVFVPATQSIAESVVLPTTQGDVWTTAPLANASDPIANRTTRVDDVMNDV